jgi:hypothetical protein
MELWWSSDLRTKRRREDTERMRRKGGRTEHQVLVEPRGVGTCSIINLIILITILIYLHARTLYFGPITISSPPPKMIFFPLS